MRYILSCIIETNTTLVLRFLLIHQATHLPPLATALLGIVINSRNMRLVRYQRKIRAKLQEIISVHRNTLRPVFKRQNFKN